MKHTCLVGSYPATMATDSHVIFHIAGKFIEYYDDFLSVLQQGTLCGGLKGDILHDLSMPEAKSSISGIRATRDIRIRVPG